MANNNYDAAAYGADRTIIALAAVMYNIHQKEKAQMERMQTQHTVDMYRLRGVPEARIQQALDERDEYQSALFRADMYAKALRQNQWVDVFQMALMGLSELLALALLVIHMTVPSLISFKSTMVLFGLLGLIFFVTRRSSDKREAEYTEAERMLPGLRAFIADARERGVPSLYIP